MYEVSKMFQELCFITQELRLATQLLTFKHPVKVLQPTLRKLQSSWEATARASSVLPVPGGPYNKQPFGGLIPTRWKSSGFRRGSSITCNSNAITFQTKENQQQGGGWWLELEGFGKGHPETKKYMY